VAAFREYSNSLQLNKRLRNFVFVFVFVFDGVGDDNILQVYSQ
jgi:hypothetical protein